MCRQLLKNTFPDVTQLRVFLNLSWILTYTNFKFKNGYSVLDTVSDCKYLGVILDEHLTLNKCSKTLSSKQHVKNLENLRIKVGSSYINSSVSVRNLVLILDNTRGKEKQVNSTCKSCYYQIRNIGLNHNYINDETCRTLVRDFIIFRLDYGNALVYNIHYL